mgnify:FL=1
MRVIDADWVHEHVKPYERSDEQWSVTGGTAIRLIHNAIYNAPTVDAVKVTRCKDCKDFHRNNENDPYCTNSRGLDDPVPDGFCNYGKPKEERENGRND